MMTSTFGTPLDLTVLWSSIVVTIPFLVGSTMSSSLDPRFWNSIGPLDVLVHDDPSYGCGAFGTCIDACPMVQMGPFWWQSCRNYTKLPPKFVIGLNIPCDYCLPHKIHSWTTIFIALQSYSYSCLSNEGLKQLCGGGYYVSNKWVKHYLGLFYNKGCLKILNVPKYVKVT